jgi:transposase, IS5 family
VALPHEGAHRVDSRHKLIHSVAATAANVHNYHPLPELLRSKETNAWGESAYQGKVEVILRSRRGRAT